MDNMVTIRKTFILLAVSVALLASCRSKGPVKLENELDSLAYVYGLDFGVFIKDIDSTLNVDIIARGISDILENREPAISMEEGTAYINEYFNVIVPIKNKKASEAFIESVKRDNPNVKVTASGLVYEVLSEGDGARPENDSDKVTVSYLLTMPDGKPLESTYKYGEPATFTLGDVIPGWTEGLKFINTGGKIKLWVPSDLAYGETGYYNIPANQALVYEIELLEVKPAPADEPAAQ